MALIKQTVKNIIAGISQQPQILRFPEQLQEQKNGYSSTVNGLQKRPPTLHIDSLDFPKIPDVQPFIHFIERDDAERYTVVFNGEDVYAFDLLGNSIAIAYEGTSKSYIQTLNPRRELKVTTVADYSFIANTKVDTVLFGLTKTDPWTTQGALVNVKSGQYGRTYSIIINGTSVASFTTPDGSVASHTAQIDTNYIATKLKDSAVANGWTCTQGEGWVYLIKTGVTITSLETKDGFNNLAMYGFLKATQRFSNLPQTAPDGFTVLVKGDTGSNSDDYYVYYDNTLRLWKEREKPGIPTHIDPLSMPHALVRQSDGTFLLSACNWNDREAGDDNSNPAPTFIGKPINEIFFIRNRLGFLSSENCIMSASGEFFRFWMATATDVLDSDPIDMSAPDESIAILRHAVPFNEELLLFSDHAQFIGTSSTIFSPKAFIINRTTKFDCLPCCRPTVAGRRVYFANARAEFSSLLEYYIVENVSAVKDAQDVSSHVPKYIPNTIHKIIGSTTENVLLLLSNGEPSRIYVYKFLWQNEARVQASWSYWDFDGANIISASFVGSDLYCVMERNGVFTLEKIVFTVDTKDFPVEPYRAYLDRKTTMVIPEGSYNLATNQTVFKVNPYSAPLEQGVTYGILTTDGIYRTLTLSPDTTDTIAMQGDVEGQTLIVGVVIHFLASFSEIMIKAEDKLGGIKANTDGRLQLRSWWVNYSDSGVFTVYVDITGKQRFSYDMTSRILGSSKNILGSLPFDSGKFSVPIQADSRETSISIESIAPTSISLIGGGWEANHVERSAR